MSAFLISEFGENLFGISEDLALYRCISYELLLIEDQAYLISTSELKINLEVFFVQGL
jgi:hypothetical protein